LALDFFLEFIKEILLEIEIPCFLQNVRYYDSCSFNFKDSQASADNGDAYVSQGSVLVTAFPNIMSGDILRYMTGCLNCMALVQYLYLFYS
jgi:hypothetical protein